MLIDKLSATDPLAQVAQVAKNLPQQEATKILKYATSSGDAPDVVAANLKAYDMDSIGSTDWENALKDAPKTKTFLSTPLPLAIVQNGENASVLAGLETENKVWSALKDGFKDAGRFVLRSGQGALEGVLSANDMPNPTAPPTASEEYLGTRLPDNYMEWAKQTQHPLAQDVAATLKDMADSKLLTPKNVQADTTLGQYGLDVVRMLPQIAAQMAVGAAAGPATALGFMGAQIAGSDYENYTKDGVDPGRAMTAALGDAALQAPLEAVGLGKIMKKVPAATPVRERVKQYIEGGLTEAVTEWLQQYPQGAADIYAKGEGKTPQQMGQQFIEDFWKNTQEGLYQGAVALPLGVLGGAVRNAMQRQATKAYVDNVEALQAQLAGSAILSQSPELVEQHLDAITGGEKAYIDPDALVMYQMENPKALEELGLTEQQVNAALETGEMIEVTKAQYVTAAAQDPALHEALKNDIAPSTDGLTRRRIDERKNEKDVQRATEKTTEEAKAVKEWSKEYSQQLKEAGLSDDMAKQVIVGLQAHARTMSDKPAAWLRENAPEFRQGSMEQAGALQQEQVKNLVALHNLSPDNFLHAVRMGGLPAPSVAISRTEHPLEKFGDITLIGSTDLVDPAQKKSKVFNADVYSPRYPTVERDIDRTALKKYEKELAGLKEYENAAPTYTDVNYLAEKAKEGKRELQYNKLAQLLFASRNGFGKEQDGTALREFIEQHKEQYSDFLDTLLADISKGERIFKGYTNSGNRRYVPHTLENVVKELTTSLRDGEGFNYGVGSLRSNVAKRYTKLAQIQKDRGKIISAEDFAKEKEIVEKEFTDILAEAHEKYTGAASKYQVTDVFMDVLKDGIKRNNITAELKQYGFEGVDVNRVHAFLNSIKNMPTEYFEAKLQRAVGLNEFKGALLPAGTSEKVKRHLDEIGVTYREYEDGKRQEVLDAFTKELNAQQGNVLFQDTPVMANGSIHWENGRAIITMMQTGNPSTVIHEMVGHFFFQNLIERAAQEDAPEQVKKDVKTLFEWAGYEGKTFDKLTREERTDLHEKVARAAEVYVMEGKSPSVATQSLFRRFAEWMKEVYRSVRELGVQVTPEVAQVFDRMLATDAEIAEMEALERYHEALPETFLATLNDRQRAHLDQELLKVRAEAEEQLRAAVMRDLRADNRTAIAEERKTAQQQIRAELEAQPLYMARAAMQAPANMKAVQAAMDARLEQLVDEQVQLLVHHAKLGVEGKVAIRDEEGYMTGEWLGGFSNKEQWYKDLLARLPQGRLPEAWGKYIDWVKAGSVVEDGDKPRRMPPKMREAFREIAIEHLEKGWYDEQFGDIPANEEYLVLRQSSPSWEIIMDNGGGLKLNEAQLAEMYPDKADKLPQNMLTKEGGFDADLLAQVFGFSSGDELLARIIDSPTLGEAVKERLQAHMQQFRDLINDKTALDGEARAAMYSDGGAALLATELQLIEEKMGKVLKAEDARQAAATAREAAKRTAQTMLAKREINEATRLQSYIAAERRAAVDTAKYLKAKDYENAAAAKERQLLNHALIMECLRIKRESERIKKYLNKQRKAKNWLSDTEDEAGLRVRTNEYRDQAASILARFGFVRKDFVEPTETLAEWVKRQEADEVNGEIINIAPWLAYENRRSTIGKLTLEELQDVENAIRNIKKMATIGVNSDGFAFINGDGKEATVQTLLDSSAKLKAKQVDKIEKEKAGWLKDFVAGLKQGHRMLEALDAFKSFGPWYQTFYDSMKRAADVRSQLLQRVTDRLENAFASEGITKAERYRMAHKQLYVREWGQSVTKNTLLAIALNMGNQGNLDRLTATRLIGVSMATPWDVESIKTVLERHLTAADFRLVGKIWKAIDVYDEYNSMVNRMTGNNLPKVEPLPIVFRPLGGEEIKLDGGYYPLSQDTRGSKQAELNAEKKLGETPGLMPYPSTGRSKSRTQGAKYAVDTDLANLYGNMTDIVQDIAFRPVAHDINKLMRDERVVSTIREKLGDPAYRAVLEWERRITSGRAENVKHPLDQFFTWARSATVISSLLLRPGVAVQNLSNVLLYGNSVEGWTNRDAAAAYLRHGWGDYIPNALANSERAKALREYVYSKSVQMRDKKNAPDFSFREINDAGQQENLLMRSGNETVQELGYKAARAQESLNKFSSDVFAWTDQLTDIPIWLGAYEKAKADGKTETQAVNFADAIIRNSTGTGRNLDTAWMQAAGSPAMRLFTMFQTFMNTAYNRWAMEANVFLQEKDAARLIKFVAGQYLAFGVMSALLSFKWPDDEDSIDEWFRKEVLDWPLGMIPLFGGLSKIMLDKAQGFKTYSYRMTPIAGKAEDVLKLASTAEKVWQGQKEGGELVEPTAALASFFLRYPDQLNDWFFNAYDALSGNMQPELRDLVRRRPKKERM
ncbi:MAG: hypothetical protein VB133_08635 [Anaeromusa sp.]|uniref:hypothetical protein n=1 Tax=Anaeromusa sp. TaxID=1872520 RepID=UPI002B1F643D|nr:hypothetical protein [Anaeromusa sp.]MEA4835187.1 hypothetical protein [Anaeromusa sp.]